MNHCSRCQQRSRMQCILKKIKSEDLLTLGMSSALIAQKHFKRCQVKLGEGPDLDSTEFLLSSFRFDPTFKRMGQCNSALVKSWLLNQMNKEVQACHESCKIITTTTVLCWTHKNISILNCTKWQKSPQYLHKGISMDKIAYRQGLCSLLKQQE